MTLATAGAGQEAALRQAGSADGGRGDPRDAIVYDGSAGQLDIPSPWVADATIDIDGQIDEAVWESAALLTGFTQFDPVEGVPATQRTEARVLLTDDAIYFAVKAYDTQSAAELLVPAVGDETAVLTLQNGIDSVPMLSSVLGAEHVIGGATWLTAHIAGPGIIEYQDALVRAAIGEPGGGISDRVETIAEALRGCGIETEVSDDITRILWSKIVLLSVHGGMSAACQLPLGDILSTEGMEDVYRKMFNEAASVGRALGVDLPESTSDDLVALLQSAPADNTTSLQVDFGHQRRVELEYLTGAVVRRGREAGVPTPALEAIYLSLKAKARAFGGI